MPSCIKIRLTGINRVLAEWLVTMGYIIRQNKNPLTPTKLYAYLTSKGPAIQKTSKMKLFTINVSALRPVAAIAKFQSVMEASFDQSLTDN